MSDIKCAKCGEPWDAYGVRNGDMEPEDAKRFNKGEGCPCCGFGNLCPSCDGSGREQDHYGASCPTCRDKGYVLAWSPRRTSGIYKVDHIYTGYNPNVREIKDPGFDNPVTLGSRTFPEKAESFESRDGWVDQWWVPCPDGPHEAIPCSTCEGTGKLTVEDPEGMAFEAAKSACHASDEDPIEILGRRGIW